MKHLLNHPLSVALSKQVTKNAFESYAQKFSKYHPSLKWLSENRAEFAFEAKGVHLAGTITLKEGSIEIEMDVPLVFKPLRSRALEIIEEEIKKWISKAEAGQL